MTDHQATGVATIPVTGPVCLRTRAAQLVTQAEDAITAIDGDLRGAGHDRTREIASDLRDAAGALSKAAALIELPTGGGGADVADYLLVATVIETAEERRVSYLDACMLHKLDIGDFRRALGRVAHSSAAAEVLTSTAAAA